jgi:hypothetical protein
MDLSEQALQARREYNRQWRKAHPEYIESQRIYVREWRKAHPEAVAKYNADYWERKAQKDEECI